MSINQLAAAEAAPPGVTPPAAALPTGLEPLPAEHQPMADDLRAFYHALPDLLADEDVGEFAVVGGGRVHGTWDTYRDASQYGLLTFPDGRFITQRMDPRFLDVLPRYFGPLPPPGGG
jgi:hypothetical protein